MKAQHGKDTPKLKGKCSSCGVNFSDHISLVGTCREIQNRISILKYFQPIRCKDRMPEHGDFPILAWRPNIEEWVIEETGEDFEEECDKLHITHWMLLPP